MPSPPRHGGRTQRLKTQHFPRVTLSLDPFSARDAQFRPHTSWHLRIKKNLFFPRAGAGLVDPFPAAAVPPPRPPVTHTAAHARPSGSAGPFRAVLARVAQAALRLLRRAPRNVEKVCCCPVYCSGKTSVEPASHPTRYSTVPACTE